MRKPLTFLLCACWTALLFHSAGAAERNPDELRILNDGYPRAFFFRKSENIPANDPDYAKWEAEFSRLMGIIGKSLDEEVLGRQTHNPEFFSRFKQENPEQVVLLHLNGNARDPRFEADNFFAGHWIYRKPADILQDLPAKSGVSVIKVSDASLFRVNMGRYANSNDDIALFGLKPDGTYDWHDCEQVRLLSVDTKANSIRVRRGQYGTKPRAFKAGSSMAVAHEVEGPWGKNNNIMWFYNYAAHCPRDKEGKTAADRYLEDLVRWFSKGGILEAYDGLEFDVLFNVTRGDTNGDGIEDMGVLDGINAYGLGVVQFLQSFREKMGSEFIIQADGALGEGGIRSQRGWAYINGIESEGWPDLNDHGIHDWSGGLNRQSYAQAFSAKPVFNYINHKFIERIPGGNPGDKRNPDLGFNIHRLVFAAACFTDSALCYSFPPRSDSKGLIGIWDELICGTDRKLGWLGQPMGPAVHMATQSSSLLPDKPLRDLISGQVKIRKTTEGIQVEPIDPKGPGFSFSIRHVPVDGTDLMVAARLKGQSLSTYPDSVARFGRLEVNSGTNLISSGFINTGMCRRGEPEQQIEQDSGARCDLRTVKIQGDTRSALAIHPPYKGKVGYTFWTRDIVVPDDSELHYAIGMGAKSPERSDGVWFSVQAAVIKDGKCGDYTKLKESSSKVHEWKPQKVSLKQFGGKEIRLKFVADCGPNNNSTTDHGYWSNARILKSGSNPDQLTPPEDFMTWVGPDLFESTFYYRHIRPGNVDLNFHIEGTRPVTISSVSAHGQPDIMYRVFENGLVLANPGLSDYTFDLSVIAPGRQFRRLKATSTQDTRTNNGSPVGSKVTIGPKDALFLVDGNP